MGSLVGQRQLCPQMKYPPPRGQGLWLSGYRKRCILCISCLLPRQAWLTGWSPVWNGWWESSALRSPTEQWTGTASVSTTQVTPAPSTFGWRLFLCEVSLFQYLHHTWNAGLEPPHLLILASPTLGLRMKHSRIILWDFEMEFLTPCKVLLGSITMGWKSWDSDLTLKLFENGGWSEG